MKVITSRLILVVSIFGTSVLAFVNCSKSSSEPTHETPVKAELPPPATPLPTQPNIPPPPPQRGNRSLGIDIVYTTNTNTFTQNANDTKTLGSEYMILDVLWNQIEVGTGTNCSQGTYNDPNNMLSSFNSTLPNLGLKMTLNFSLSTTNLWSAPSNFVPSDFTADPKLQSTKNKINLMICRYNNALNFVLSHLPNVQIVGLQIGNEIDYLPEAQLTNFWANYWSFLAGTSAYAKTLRTTAVTSPLSVGVTTSLAGAIGGKGAIIQGGIDAINQTITDYLAINYYPFESGGSQSKIDDMQTNFKNLVTQAKTKKIRIQEFGCQSGTVSGSSEDLQSSCFTTLFGIWDENIDKITHIHFLRLSDTTHSDAVSTATTYSGGAQPSPTLVDYIESLGLKFVNGSQKKAFNQIKNEIKIRGW